MITPSLLAQVAEATGLYPAMASLRAQYPGIHFTECSADDVISRVRPVLETETLEFYLVSGASGHCLALTSEFEAASGILVATKADE